LQALRFFRDHGVKVLRVMTDNGVSFRSLTSRHGIANAENQAQAHQTLYAKNKRKGRTQTSLREWAKPAKGSGRRSLLEWPAEGYAKPYNHSSERAAALLPFLHHYNHHGLTSASTDAHLSQGSQETTRDTTPSACPEKVTRLFRFRRAPTL
jgi:hypothetical protein